MNILKPIILIIVHGAIYGFMIVVILRIFKISRDVKDIKNSLNNLKETIDKTQ